MIAFPLNDQRQHFVMTRKAFFEDLALAAADNIPGVTDVKRGEEHGEIYFTFAPAEALPFGVIILITGS